MKRILITTLLVLLFLPLGAQNVEPPQITLSTEKVNIGGNIYLIHKVEQGETIYSLCRAYKVDSEELFKANPQLKEGLKAGKIIYIPTSAKAEISQPGVSIKTAEKPQKSIDQEVPEKDYIEHKVKLFETLSSISRRYGISIQEIMDLNGLEDTTIWFQQILRIPIKKELEEPEEADTYEEEAEEPVRSIEEEPENMEQEVPEKDYIKHKVKLFETLHSISRKYGLSVQEIMEFNKLENSAIWFRQILRIPIKEALEEPEEELEDEEKETEEIKEIINEGFLFEEMSKTEALAKIELLKGITHFDRTNPIKIALLLPFDTHSTTPSTNYLDFYSGALMAVEKAKKAGMHIALNTIDITTYSWIGEIFRSNMIRDCDLVVGHVDAKQINAFTDYCNNNRIPFVSPLDQQTDSLALNNPYFFQMPVTAATQIANLIGRINLGYNSRLTLFSDASGSEEPYRRSILAAIDSAGLPYKEVRYHIVSGRTIIDSLLTTMSPDVEHHIVVASEQEAFASDVIRNMGVLKFHGYKIKVYCSNKIRNFETIEGVLLHEVNTHFSTNYYVDYKDKATKEFILGYRALFKTEPTPFAFHGYDTFLYFIKVINDLGKDFSHLIYYYPMNMLQNDIHFRRTGPNGGFVNIESRDVEYTPDKRITVK